MVSTSCEEFQVGISSIKFVPALSLVQGLIILPMLNFLTSIASQDSNVLSTMQITILTDDQTRENHFHPTGIETQSLPPWVLKIPPCDRYGYRIVSELRLFFSSSY